MNERKKEFMNEFMSELIVCLISMLLVYVCMYVADSELVLKFSAGLAVSVNLVATVENVQHIDRLRVQVHDTLVI